MESVSESLSKNRVSRAATAQGKVVQSLEQIAERMAPGNRSSEPPPTAGRSKPLDATVLRQVMAWRATQKQLLDETSVAEADARGEPARAKRTGMHDRQAGLAKEVADASSDELPALVQLVFGQISSAMERAASELRQNAPWSHVKQYQSEAVAIIDGLLGALDAPDRSSSDGSSKRGGQDGRRSERLDPRIIKLLQRAIARETERLESRRKDAGETEAWQKAVKALSERQASLHEMIRRAMHSTQPSPGQGPSSGSQSTE